MIEKLKPNDRRIITADVPIGYAFSRWTGDIQYLQNPLSATTIVTMGNSDVIITANINLNMVYPKYGLLYNWYAATDSRKITSSDDWFVPTRTILYYVSTYLGFSISAKLLKEAGLVHWNDPNIGSNSVGFNGRGAGNRNADGVFGGLGFYLRVVGIRGTEGYYMQLNNAVDYDSGFNWAGDTYKHVGVSIRLFRNCTSEELLLPDGPVETTYSGNDSKVYRCCKIGNYIITADNLAETKFRNGDWIPGFDNGTYTPISNSTWSGLTTGAMCFYNDVINNG